MRAELGKPSRRCRRGNTDPLELTDGAHDGHGVAVAGVDVHDQRILVTAVIAAVLAKFTAMLSCPTSGRARRERLRVA